MLPLSTLDKEKLVKEAVGTLILVAVGAIAGTYLCGQSLKLGTEQGRKEAIAFCIENPAKCRVEYQYFSQMSKDLREPK